MISEFPFSFPMSFFLKLYDKNQYMAKVLVICSLSSYNKRGGKMSSRRRIDPGWKWDDNFIFSQAIQVGNTIYLSGQVALDPDGNVVGKGDMKAQTRQAWENIKTILEVAGASLDDVVKITQFVTDMSRFMETQEVRREYFTDPPPAATTVEVKSLAFPDLLIEIEVMAVKSS